MDLSSSLEMSRASDEMPDLNLDFSNFDLSQFVTADDNATMGTQHLHMHSISAPHSANTSPMLNPVQDYSGGYSTSQVVNNNEVARLQHHLEQQRRLNELNQLQNRILQQQLEIMGSQPPTSHVHVGYQGLMTPVSSTELRPTMYDTNMIQGLSNALGNNQDLIRSLLSPAVTPNMVASSSHSHPSPFPTSHGTPTDFFSPLTSPALGPSPNPTHSFRPSPAIPSPAQSTFPSLPSPSFGPTRQKRGAGALSDVEIARKRASPIVKPTPPPKSSATTKRTPRMRARADSIAQPQPRASPLPSPRPSGTIEPVGDVPNSTPSPVDISTTLAMPPPVVPFARTGAGSGGSGEDVAMDLGGSSADGTPVASAGGSPSLAPVTPASLMNLGHIATRPTGLMHSGSNSPGESQKSTTTTQTAGTSKAKSAGSTGGSNRKEKDRTKDAEQAKGAPKGKVPIAKAGGGRPSPAILPMISPAIKPHLPGGTHLTPYIHHSR
ncbi:hypothetical protein BDV93DRAFT_134531 [Ceratobasidium sp. AG-I]|nr:hypothetical protein BDV93DRAFT_134531 [Ceratobasidium sp. AG-I]